MKSNVRRITDGAMIVAIMGLLTVLDGQSGMLLDGLLFWFIPIPIILYVVKYDLNSGIIIAVSVTLLSFIISLPHLAILMGFSSLIGLAYGYGINKKLSVSKTLVLTFFATLAYYLLSMIVFAKFFGYNPQEEITEIINFFTQVFNNISTSNFDIITFLRWTNPFFAMLIMFVPFIPVLISIMQTILTHLVSVILLKRLKLAEVEVKPFFLIKIDKKLATIALLTLMLTYAYFIFSLDGLQTVIMILQFVSQMIFIVMGAILMLTYVSLKQKPLLAPLVGLLVLSLPLLVMFVGIIDVFTNIRYNLIRRSIDER